ncbi:MAG TPA: ABC transporter permease subunit, partial [Micromonosporaceae bacterium]|nr:ABC transporter permease subunit [Micromonosporaceae bacterium]
RQMRRLLRAEWTKLLTVRRWMLALVAMAVLSLAFGLLAAAGRDNTNQRDDLVIGPHGLIVNDNFRFVHQPLDGDGTIVARVTGQDASHPDATAGIMIKNSLRPGSSYASLSVTPRHGLRLGANFDTDLDAGAGRTPVWLRLTRAGTVVTASRSDDGTTWRTVGTVRLVAPPAIIQVGLFVASPPKVTVSKTLTGTGVGGDATTGRATFDDVQVTGATSGIWTSQNIGDSGDSIDAKPGQPGPGSSVEAGGIFSVTGSGTIGPGEADDDPTQDVLFGLFFGVLALIPVAVLFMTSEYRRHLILTTFGASPRRRWVLAAKAAVIGAASFATGLVASLATYLITRPVLEAHGHRPPAWAYTSLGDPGVLRAVVGSALLVAALGVLSLGIATLVRNGAAAISIVVGLFILPAFVAAPLPLLAAKWLMLLTPAGGLAIQRAKSPTDTLAEPWSMLPGWLGLGVAAAYAAVALAFAMWRVERRDA